MPRGLGDIMETSAGMLVASVTMERAELRWMCDTGRWYTSSFHGVVVLGQRRAEGGAPKSVHGGWLKSCPRRACREGFRSGERK